VSASRVLGRGRILYALEGLRRRLEKFIAYRAATAEERQWGNRLADALDLAYLDAIATPGAQRGLEAVRERRARSRKVRR
jgi:hypothetical protein